MRLDLRKLTAFVIIAPADTCECLTTRSPLLEHGAFRESYENKSLVARNGQRFVLEFGPGDEFYHAVSERPLWESWMEPCIDRIAEASGDAMALDIGANMGQHAVYLGSKFRRVVAFEPQPLKALQVQRNARHNALDNVRVCRCGLAFSRGYAHIFNMTVGTPAGPSSSTRRTETRRCTTARAVTRRRHSSACRSTR